MITELDALTEVEQILSQHWTHTVLPAERRAIRATQRLGAQLSQPQGQPDGITSKDVAIVLLAATLLMAIGWNLA